MNKGVDLSTLSHTSARTHTLSREDMSQVFVTAARNRLVLFILSPSLGDDVALLE